MVQTRSGKRTYIETSKKYKKHKKMRRKFTEVHIASSPLTVSLTSPEKNYEDTYTFMEQVLPGTILYVAKQKHCNQKWYTGGRVIKSWIYNVFLTRETCEKFIENYNCGEDKWIETSKIYEIKLKE